MFSMAFLGSALSSTLIYIWSRKNPDTLLSFLGLLVFKAPYLPWVLLCFSLIMHGTVPKDEMCGIVVGHSELSGFYMSDLGLTYASLVLLQRHLPAASRRSQSPRSTIVVDSFDRRSTGPCRRGHGRDGSYRARPCRHTCRGRASALRRYIHMHSWSLANTHHFEIPQLPLVK
jgi:hypothetical protein